MTNQVDSVKSAVSATDKVQQQVRDSLSSKDEEKHVKDQSAQTKDRKSDYSPSESSEQSARDRSRDLL